MNGQEQIISSRKNWATPFLTILTRQGEQENILVTCKVTTNGLGGPNSDNLDCYIAGGDCSNMCDS